MKLFKSIKKFCGKVKDVFASKIDETTTAIENKNIVSLATKDVRDMKEKVQDGINKAAELKLNIDKMENEKEKSIIKFNKASKDYETKITQIKEMIINNANIEEINAEKIEESAILKIKKSIESAIQTLTTSIDSMKKSYKQLTTGLKVMNTNISVMECELANQKTKKIYIDMHNKLVTDVNGCLSEEVTPYLAKLTEINSKDENIIELKEEVFGDSKSSVFNMDVDDEVEKQRNAVI